MTKEERNKIVQLLKKSLEEGIYLNENSKVLTQVLSPLPPHPPTQNSIPPQSPPPPIQNSVPPPPPPPPPLLTRDEFEECLLSDKELAKAYIKESSVNESYRYRLLAGLNDKEFFKEVFKDADKFGLSRSIMMNRGYIVDKCKESLWC